MIANTYLRRYQRHRFWLMHAPRGIFADKPLYLNEIVRECRTVSHPAEPRCGHAIDGALLVMSPPISDGGDNQPGANVVGYLGDALEATGPIVHFHLVTVLDHTLGGIVRANENKLIALHSLLFWFVGVVCIQERVAFRSDDV